MIRLGKIDRTMRPREVAPGVVLTMRPACSIDVEQAQGEAARIIAGVLTAPEALVGFGLDDHLPMSGRDAEQLVGLSTYLAAALLMELIVEDWDGVADEHGAALPLDRAGIGRFLLHPGMKQAFEREAYAAVRTERDEGNGSAASANGSAEAAARTARGAAKRARTAERAVH